MVDDTLRCIRESVISLLEENAYSEIRMKEIAERANIGRRTLYRYFDNKEMILKYLAESLMDRFAEEIEKQEEITLQTVTHSFYVFIDANRTEFMILKKARLLSYMEDCFPELMKRVASKTKYKGKSEDEINNMLTSYSVEDRYAFYYTIAGYWRMAMTWMTDAHPLSPEEMTLLTIKIMKGEK